MLRYVIVLQLPCEQGRTDTVAAAASPADRACEDAVSVTQLTQWTAVERAAGVVDDDDDDSVVTSSQHCVIDDPMIGCKGRGKGKRSIAALKTPRRYGAHMPSHGVTCHPTEVTFPPSAQPKLVLD